MFVIVTLLIILVGLTVFRIVNKNLKFDDIIVTEAYKYLGNGKLNTCGGDFIYSIKEATYDSLEDSVKICNAHLYTDKSEEVKLDKKSAKKLYCEVNDDIKFTLDYESDTCSIEKYQEIDIEEAYFKIYGEKLEEHQNFELNKNSLCIYNSEEGEYLCGNEYESEIVSLPSSTSYRVMDAAIIKFGDTLVIRDYFINHTDNKCYVDLQGVTENLKCTTDTKEYDHEFTNTYLKTYGTKYEHTYKKIDGEYYWVSTIRLK